MTVLAKDRQYIAIYYKILYHIVLEVVYMQIVTININKGGTGKSTFSYNFSKWLSSRKNKKVLLIDGDSSCNLTYSFKELGQVLFMMYLKEEVLRYIL